jgi:hypothetical protein
MRISFSLIGVSGFGFSTLWYRSILYKPQKYTVMFTIFQNKTQIWSKEKGNSKTAKSRVRFGIPLNCSRIKSIWTLKTRSTETWEISPCFLLLSTLFLNSFALAWRSLCYSFLLYKNQWALEKIGLTRAVISPRRPPYQSDLR